MSLPEYPTDAERAAEKLFRDLAVAYADAEMRWWDAEDNSREEDAGDIEADRLRELYRQACMAAKHAPPPLYTAFRCFEPWHRRLWFRLRRRL